MALITCPTDCATGGVPDVSFDLCTPQYKFGEIGDVYLAAADQPLTLGDASEFTTRLAAPTGDATKMVHLHGLGELPAGSGETNRISSKYSITPKKDRTLPFTLYDVNDTNYEFARRVDKCGGKFLMWYVNSGDMYGGESFNDGIPVDVTANIIIPRSDKENATIEFTFSWSGAMSERKASVLS